MKRQKSNKLFPIIITTVISAMALSVAVSPELRAETSKEWKPPRLISLAAISIRSTGFAAGTGLVSTISDKTGVQFRIEPAPTSIDRAERVKSGMVEFALSAGGHAYSLQTGLADFDLKGWGPQPVRTVWAAGYMNAGYMTRGDSGIKTVADMKGKRVASYPSYPGLQMNMEGLLAYAGLSWDDVKATPVGGFGPGMAAVIEGSVDVAYAPAMGKPVIELAASPHGIHWLPMPASNTAGWKRFRDLWGCWLPGKAMFGGGISKENPAEIMKWPYNVTNLADSDANLSYWMTKQITENYDDFKGKHGYLRSWSIAQALNTEGWLVPYHEGSIVYFKEIGKWGADQETRQQELLDEQKSRRVSWEAAHPNW